MAISLHGWPADGEPTATEQINKLFTFLKDKVEGRCNMGIFLGVLWP